MMPQAMSASGSRRLLKRLRDVMAASGSAQERLDQVVRIIAADMVAEVCSVYLIVGGGVLELFATEGLNPSAVHKTRLRVGEGLVGDVAAHARPLNLADAQTHPHFAYRPETGEEIYHSLMGVPILRAGRVLGVLVVQNRTRRHYTEEEVETLQTVAMVLAELVAGGELLTRDEMLPADGSALLPVRLEGIRLNPGLAIGHAVLHQPIVTIRQMVAEDPHAELERMRGAISGMHSALDNMLAASDIAADGEHRDILESYRMFAQDRGWLSRITEAVKSGLTAEAAVQKVREDNRARMGQINDPYLRERLLDLEDLANRLLQHLAGREPMVPAADLPDDVILIARSMGPAELLDYDRRQVRALVLEEGSPTAHVAIVARALDIPVVGRVKDAMSRIQPLESVIVDGDNAVVYVRPGDDVQQAVAESIGVMAERRAAYAALRDTPAVTRDGVPVSLHLNAGLLVDLHHVREVGADGIGLYRTELPFMVRGSFPDVPSQIELYRKVFEQIGDKPVVFRTLDIGGDKRLPYWNGPGEDNPAMGWRAIRIALDRPAMLRHQLRALIRAAEGRPLNIMFPMIAEVAEFKAARTILGLEIERARRRSEPLPEPLRVGAMLEVPALVWQLPALLRCVDFLSIGSNDLLQFMFASDRGNPRLADRYDVLSPPVLAFLSSVIAQASRAGVPVSLCGEMAGHPLEAMALVGLGMRTISMPPSAIGPVKTMTRSLELAPLQRYLRSLLDVPDHSVREKLRMFANDHSVVI